MRTYTSFDPLQGYPAGTDLYYECGICGDVLPSLPKDSIMCSCKNITIDADYGRISIRDHGMIKLFSLK